MRGERGKERREERGVERRMCHVTHVTYFGYVTSLSLGFLPLRSIRSRQIEYRKKTYLSEDPFARLYSCMLIFAHLQSDRG